MKAFLAAVLVLSLPVCALAAEYPADQIVDKTTVNGVEIPLYSCTDDEFKLKVLCNPDWGLETYSEAFLMAISEDPAVTLTIVKLKFKIEDISQLTDLYLQETKHYAKGFATERVLFAGHEAVMVKSFAAEYPEIRLLDYYVIHEGQLYGFFFSVNPKESWDDYQFLIKKISQSVEFYKFDNNTEHL
jgi:hypothetical protein